MLLPLYFTCLSVSLSLRRFSSLCVCMCVSLCDDVRVTIMYHEVGRWKRERESESEIESGSESKSRTTTPYPHKELHVYMC